ncbi:macrophage mannose receptor 1-like [Chelmon rostratus]|uniref:macrophage mannose receptor 1-like n=1 Tax=Chelmon rostratus TaxID=109905 RepID=UPI001BE64CF0|nr:macrophage mannose receptor 1-like [Chelmon rostratus]
MSNSVYYCGGKNSLSRLTFNKLVSSLGCHIFSARLLHQYHFVDEPMNWTEAQTYCRKKHTDLATIENGEEVMQFRNTFLPFEYNSKVWIGLYSKLNWEWSDGYEGPGADYKKWKVNEPNFYIDNELCVASGGNNDPWHDDPCSKNHRIICNNGAKLDPKFIIVKEGMNWPNAQKYCRENFVDLATLRNDNESLEIQTMVENGWAWIGLFRDPHIYWSDGSSFSFKYWFTGPKPLNSLSLVCGVADLQASGKWTLFPCDRKLPFVCYSTRVIRQVVKLRMKPGDSSVDLNDPAVKEDLLKKFQDRLKTRGVKGVTLKWIKQSDGKVFHKDGKSSQKKKRNKSEL